MLIWLKHYIFGFLFIELTGYSPERFFNMCNVHRIELWKINNTGHSYRFFMTVKGFRNIKSLVRKSKVKLRIVKKFGLPFFLYRNRKRKLYVAGLAGFFLILYTLSIFIWDIEFEGNHRYTYDMLLKFCQSENIFHGVRKSTIDCEVLEEALRTKFPEITWVSARVSGTRLLVKIKENEVLSEIPPKDQSPCDIVAERDGIVTFLVVRSGVAKVSKGDAVEKGQVLVSGTIPITGDSEEIINVHLVHADADVNLKTEHYFERYVPLFKSVDVDTGKTRTGYYFKAFDWSFLLIWPKPQGTTWKLTMEEEQLHLFQNFYLPLYAGVLKGKEYITYERPYTEKEKDQLAQTINEEIKKNLLEKGVQILENHVKILDSESLCRIAMDFVVEGAAGTEVLKN